MHNFEMSKFGNKMSNPGINSGTQKNLGIKNFEILM